LISAEVFPNPDGTTRPALPEKVGGGATPAAASAEDLVILRGPTISHPTFCAVSPRLIVSR
jgi:hypothetical protein